MSNSTTTQDQPKAIKISAKNFSAVLAAAIVQIGPEATLCNDNLVRLCRSSFRPITEVYEICRVKGVYAFRKVV